MQNKMYMLIYEQVKKDIIEGRFAKGSRIPSKRSMAENMGVSVITVEHAYELLNEEGFITSREKSGYFVTLDAGSMYYHLPDHEIPPAFEKSGSPVKADQRGTSKDRGGIQKTSDAPVISSSLYARTVRRVLTDYAEDIMQRSPMNGASFLSCSDRIFQISHDCNGAKTQ